MSTLSYSLFVELKDDDGKLIERIEETLFEVDQDDDRVVHGSQSATNTPFKQLNTAAAVPVSDAGYICIRADKDNATNVVISKAVDGIDFTVLRAGELCWFRTEELSGAGPWIHALVANLTVTVEYWLFGGT